MLRERFRKTAFGAHHENRIAFAAFGENLNCAGESARAVKRALRPSRDFDAIDIVDSEIGEIHLPGQTLVDRYPIEQTWVCSERSPRVKTEVSWPGAPVCTTERPGTSRKASATRSICFSSKSCEVRRVTLAGD